MSLLPLRRRGRSPGPLVAREGVLDGGLPYLAVGQGPPLVVLPGFRAEHANPTGPERRFYLRPLRPLARQFTVYLVSRKPGLPAGATIADLAADYAEALERTFTSPVVVVGSSTGGSIAQQLAIDHPELVDRLVLVASACRLGPGGRRMQRDLARFTLAGRPRRAWAATGPGLAATKVGGRLYGALLWLFGPKLDPADPSDMLIVVDAEDRFDAAPQLRRITAPTLVIAGDRDRNYTPELFWETAERIPGARLRLYPGKGHAGIATLAYKPAVRELLGFLRKRGADGGHHHLFQMPVFRVLVGARGLPQRLADTVRRRGHQAGMSSAAPTFRLRDRPSMGWMVLGEPPASQQVAPGPERPLSVGTAAALHALAQARAHHRRGLQDLVPRYSGRDRYRPPPRWYARLQWLGFALTWLGLSPRQVVTLEVPGRRSGVIRKTNLLLAEHDGERYLVALAGESEWVRNVRAAGGRVVLGRRRQRRAATLVEVPAKDRAPIILAYLLRWGRRPGSAEVAREARGYFGVNSDPTLAELGSVADHYPVFRVIPQPNPGASTLGHAEEERT